MNTTILASNDTEIKSDPNMYSRRAQATHTRRQPARNAAREQLASVNLCSRRLAADEAQAEDESDSPPIDYAAELEELEEGMMDQDDWQRGGW